MILHMLKWCITSATKNHIGSIQNGAITSTTILAALGISEADVMKNGAIGTTTVVGITKFNGVNTKDRTMARVYVPNKTEKTIRKAIAQLETVKSSVE
mgnify:CR=1 FL=1